MNILFKYIDSKIPDDVPKPWVISILIWLIIVAILMPILLLSNLKLMLLYRLVFIITFTLTIGFIACVIWLLYDFFTGNKTHGVKKYKTIRSNEM